MKKIYFTPQTTCVQLYSKDFFCLWRSKWLWFPQNNCTFVRNLTYCGILSQFFTNLFFPFLCPNGYKCQPFDLKQCTWCRNISSCCVFLSILAIFLFHCNNKNIVGLKWKNSAIRNCWMSVRGAKKLHTFGTHAEGVQFYSPRTLIQQFYC